MRRSAISYPLLALLISALTACGGVFESDLPSAQAFVLRPPPRTVPMSAAQMLGSLRVQRPEAGPGLDSDRIALLRSDRRFDVYAASRWAAPVPDMVEHVVVETLRGSGFFQAVFDDASPYPPIYDLRITLKRFEADYTAGGPAPTVYVTLECTLGRHRDRSLLASFSASGSAAASEDRLTAVVAAFEAATAVAMAELERTTVTTLGDDVKKQLSESR